MKFFTFLFTFLLYSSVSKAQPLPVSDVLGILQYLGNSAYVYWGPQLLAVNKANVATTGQVIAQSYNSLAAIITTFTPRMQTVQPAFTGTDADTVTQAYFNAMNAVLQDINIYMTDQSCGDVHAPCIKFEPLALLQPIKVSLASLASAMVPFNNAMLRHLQPATADYEEAYAIGDQTINRALKGSQLSGSGLEVI